VDTSVFDNIAVLVGTVSQAILSAAGTEILEECRRFGKHLSTSMYDKQKILMSNKVLLNVPLLHGHGHEVVKTTG